MDRVFVIDIGSNSIRLMQADLQEGAVTYCHKQLITARLGEKTPGTSAFTAAAIERGVSAVEELVGRAKSVDKNAPIWAFATSAVRDAENREDLLQQIKERTGVAVQVLSGAEEAEIGAAGALPGQDGGMLDIGGSSTEVVVKRHGKLILAHSFNIGCVRARNLFPDETDPAIYAWAYDAFCGLKRPKTDVTVAVGGTPTSLAAAVLELREYDPAAVDGCVLEKDALLALREQLLPLAPAQRAQRWCLDARRAEIILYGIAIILAFMDAYHVSQVVVSEADNLEGYLQYKLVQQKSLK